MLDRRKFISRSFAVAGISLVNPGFMLGLSVSGSAQAADSTNANAASAISAPSHAIELFPNIPLSETRDAADKLLGSTFYILVGDTDVVEATLDSVEDQTTRYHTDNYALVFHTHWDLPLSEQTYTVEHPALGQFSLYFKPSTTRGSNGFYYEVLVSHLVS